MNKRMCASLLAVFLMAAFIINSTATVFADSATTVVTDTDTDIEGEGEGEGTDTDAGDNEGEVGDNEGEVDTNETEPDINDTDTDISETDPDAGDTTSTSVTDTTSTSVADTTSTTSTTVTEPTEPPVTELTIIKQPTDTYGALGSQVRTTVVAEGDELTYQWYVKNANAEDFCKSSIKSSAYVFTLSDASDGRQVYCVVSDKYGNAVISDPATFRLSALKIVEQPTDAGSPIGSTASVSVVAEGEGLTYRWYIKDALEDEFTACDATQSTYSLTMSEATVGRQAYCVISDAVGNTITTKTVSFEISGSLTIVNQPTDAFGAVGTKVSASVDAEGNGLKYQWYVKNPDAASFVKSSITTAVYSYQMTEEKSGRQVYCVVTDKYGSVVTSDTVTFRISTLKITQQPLSVGAAVGTKVRVSVTAEGEELKYQWYVKNPDAASFVKSSITTATYTVALTEANSGRLIYCVVTDASGESVTSDTAVIEIAATLKIVTQPTDVTAAADTTVRTSVVAEGEGLKYQWYVKNPNAASFVKSSITAAAYIFRITETNAGRQVYCVVTDKYGNSVTSDTVTFLRAALKITAQPLNVSAAIGEKASVSVTAEGEGLTYQWYVKNPTSTTFVKSSITASKYTFAMSEANSGRQVYCVVTDKYGNSVQSQIAVMGIAAGLKITQQPTDCTAPIGVSVDVSVIAEGIDLKYQWYVKNADSTAFAKSSIKSAKYCCRMTDDKNGRQIYCVITDSSGNTVTSDTVTFRLADPLTIVKQPVDFGGLLGTKVSTSVVAKGDGLTYQWFYKEKGGASFAYSSVTTDTYATMANAARDGRQIYCVVTDKYGISVKTDVVTINLFSHYITLDLGTGETAKQGVLTDNTYSIKDPERLGYAFTGWVDEQGNPFASTGTCESEARVTATWKLYGVDSLDKLLEFTDAGAEIILITGDIVVTEPIYISYNTTIYADGDYSIIRHPDYAGDIFVVGRDKTETPSVMLQRKAVLTLGGGKGTLTVDGNKDNVNDNVTVTGTAVFVGDSATLNLYDGARIANNKKAGNERVHLYDKLIGEYTRLNIGGGAIINLYATVNMYGGVVENNETNTEQTSVPNEDGSVSARDINGHGGAIFNRGGFNMYGGVIRNNAGIRGGAIYNVYKTRIVSGTVSGNYSGTYGGAICSSSGSSSDLYIGSEDDANAVLIQENHSHRAGGAYYSTTNSPVIIYGNTTFEGNTTDSSGAAIYTAGTAVIKDTVFRANESAANGGAIYHQYSTLTYSQRLLSVTDCTFEENKAKLGGAIIFSANDDVNAQEKGDLAVVTNCTFNNNEAIKTSGSNGNGGALYATRFADVTVSNCSFNGNVAGNTGGAVSIHTHASVKISECNFTENHAVTTGAVHVSVNTTVKLTNLVFTGNYTTLNAKGGGGNAGAMYVASDDVTFKNLTFTNNHAANNGGAMYINAVDVTLGADCQFVGNGADGHGGAAYLTYQTLEDGTKDGSVLTANGVLFKENSAMAGGVISARTACHATLSGAQLVDNYATGTEQDASGGGALYVGYGSATLTNVTATGNASAGYGGVVNAYSGNVTVTGGTFSGNHAPSGGVINALNSSNITVDDATLSANESTYENTDFDSNKGGGAVNINGGTLSLTDTLLDGNMSGYYGGTLLARGATVTVNGGSVKNSVGGTGAALYFKGNCTVTVTGTEIADNTSSKNGVIYANGGTLTANDLTATGNKATDGGVLFVSGKTTVNVNGGTFSANSAKNGGVLFHTGSATVTFDNASLCRNTATGNGGVFNHSGSSTVNVTDCSLAENTAKLGGAIYADNATFALESNTFTANAAGTHGGAVYVAGATVTATGNNVFTENAAGSHGGAVYVVYTTNEDNTKNAGVLNMTDGEFVKNTAMGGGAVSVRSACEATFDGTAFTENAVTGYTNDNDGDGEGGGAIYVGFGDVTLTNVTATGNTAELGGVIDTYNGDVTVSGGTFGANTATSGGVIYAPGGNNVTISGATLSANESTDTTVDGAIGGGAINIKGGTLSLTDTVLDGNKSAYYGGAVNARGTTVTISGGEMKNNRGKTGAALYFRDSCKVTMENVAISGNTATYNGVVYTNSGTLTITGGTATGNNVNKGGLLYTSGGTNTLTGITVSGNTATTGGVIYAAGGTTNLTNATVSGNTATTGGVVYAEGKAKVNVNTCTVSENTAENGGVIYAEGGTVTMTDATVSGNSATTGGALYLAETATVTVNGGSFTKNSAKNGGAIYTTGTLTVDGSSFTENSATVNGGAVYVYKTQATVNNATFTGNSAANHGGAMYVAGATVNASGDNAFTNNSADSHGGAVYVVYITDDDSTRLPGVFNMSGGVFDGNTALGGGAVSVRSACEATFDGTTFTNNSVTGYAGDNDGDGEGGGAIYVGFGAVTLTNVTATGNTAELGGVIDTYNGDVTVSGGTFSANTATSGGVIYAPGGNNVTISGATLSANESTDTTVDGAIGGGAINIKGGTLSLTDTVLDGNKSAFYGGAINARGTTVTINGGEIKNSVGKTGAALYFRDSSKVTMENVAITDNAAASNGVVYTNSGTLTMTGITATGNTAKNGGLLYASAGKITLTNVTATGNTATSGGVMYVCGSATVTATDCTLTANTATDGGVAYLEGKGKVTFSGGLIDGNSAANGSVATVTENGAVTIDGATVSNNNATSKGSVYANGGTVTVTNTTATGNYAAGGGVLYITQPATATLEGNVFEQNASKNGGVIYAYNTAVTLTDNTFTANTATGNGGAMYVAGGTVTATGDNTFTENAAAGHGGAVYVSYTTNDDDTRNPGVLNMTGGAFAKNTAMAGGAVSVRSACEATFDGTAFTENAVEGDDGTLDGNNEGGGAIYVGFGAVTLNNVTATGNTATNGGVIDAYNGSVTVNGGTFSANSATNKGGAIFATTGAAVTVSDNAAFTANTAPTGGAVYLNNNATATVADSTFDGNTATDGNGGAIVIADSTSAGTATTTLIAERVTFQNNTASAKGGALSTDESSTNLVINATDCVFSANKALGAGGGAVEIQNGNCKSATDPTEVTIVFTSCRFTGNTAKTTGAAVEIRTYSCAKFDSIEATDNSAKGAGGVIYVTSNYSRLYLTGTVTVSGNSSSDSSFITLYNSSYSCPPKLYTTHSSSAEWYSSVKGNKTNVAFDLTQLP